MKPPRRDMPAAADHVDALRAQWKRELPDVDTSPMEILGRVRRLALLVSPSIEAALRVHGLGRSEFDVLASLRRAGPPFRLAPTDLYHSLMVPSGSLTHRLARLESAGLVARELSPTDGRSRLIRLTKKGRATVEGALRDDMAAEAGWLEHLGTEERKALTRGLRALLLSVEARFAAETSTTDG